MKKVLLFLLMSAFIINPACSVYEKAGLLVLPEEAAAGGAEELAEDREVILHPTNGVINTGSFINLAALRPKLPPVPAADSEKIKGLVISHHTVAAELCAAAIAPLAKQKPPAVILLGPNHYNFGPPAAATLYDWQYGENKFYTDQAAVKRLAKANLASIDNRPFAYEHSTGMLAPLIGEYVPEARIIPVIFHHGYPVEKILAILDCLTPEIEAGAVIVASIDFSHYLTMLEAEEKDRQTEAYLTNRDIDIISNLDSTYIDSPTVMAALMKYFAEDELEITANTNSGRLLKNADIVCTSYFMLRFY
jgi:AmmeMemoRadiSam system protein B